MNQKIILCDMDGAICDLTTKWRQAYNDRFGVNISEEQFFSKGNEVHEAVGCGDEIYDIFKQPGFFSDLPPIPGAIETIRKYNGYCYFIILTSISCCGEIAKGKYEWLDRYMPFFNKKNVMFCKRKELVYGDVLIEDNVKNASQWADRWLDGRALLIPNVGNKSFIDDHGLYECLFEDDPWQDIDRILAVINRKNPVSQ